MLNYIFISVLNSDRKVLPIHFDITYAFGYNLKSVPELFINLLTKYKSYGMFIHLPRRSC